MQRHWRMKRCKIFRGHIFKSFLLQSHYDGMSICCLTDVKVTVHRRWRFHGNSGRFSQQMHHHILSKWILACQDAKWCLLVGMNWTTDNTSKEKLGPLPWATKGEGSIHLGYSPLIYLTCSPNTLHFPMETTSDSGTLFQHNHSLSHLSRR